VKTIGLIGGMSWESSALYYRRINELVKERLGGLHSARLILFSVDFHDIELLQASGNWEEAGRLLATAARSLETAGADFLILCTNTMHKMAPVIEAAVHIPLLHIADPTAQAVKNAGISTVGLLGTRFTMEEAFYRGRLESQNGLSVVIPDAHDRQAVHEVIFNELCLGVVKEISRRKFKEIIGRLVARGAEGIILGCTEIGMLVSSRDAPVPIFDTTDIHAERAVQFSLQNH
jgi:aspartate racemase